MSFRLTLRCCALLACSLAASAAAQEQPPLAGEPDSLAVSDGPSSLTDTLVTPAPESPPLGVRVAPPASGGLDRPVTYAARDSLRIVLAGRDTTASDRATLYGDVTAKYEEATLTAGVLELDFERQQMRALPALPDSAGQPVPARFEQGSDGFSGDELVYNLETQRGRVVGARTAIEEGFLLGGVVKQAAPHVIYAADAAYTTCELDHPHYSVVAGRMKIVDQEYVYTGPVQLHLLGIPMPLWLPFGYFPAAEGRRSGPLPVAYGEDRAAFGFYLENLGWYWAASDYFDALVRAKVGTRGSYQLGGIANYARRYAFDGALDVSYARLRRGERADPDFALENVIGVTWRHAQEFDPTARLNANVNLRSSATRFTTNQYDERVSQTSTSRVSFAKTWRGGRSIGLDLSGTQRLNEGAADLTLPSFSFSQQRLFPFRRGAGRGEAWYEQLGIDYRGTLTNTYGFSPLPDSVLAGTGFEDVSWIEGLYDYDAYRGATGEAIRYRGQAQHAVSTSAAYTINRLPGNTPFFLTLNPAVRYTETWYDRSERRSLDGSGGVQIEQETGFTAVRRVSLNLSTGTRLYGTFPLRLGALDGLRHTLTPQATLSFEPDYSEAPFNYFRSYTDTAGAVVEYPIVAGLPNRPTQRLGVSIGNVFQTRLARTDSTGETTRTPLQLLSLNLRSGYDFSAEERPLSDVSLDLSSQLDQLRLRLDATFSPYALDSLGRPSPTTYLTETGRLLRTTNVNLSLGASFRGGGGPARDLPGALPPGAAGLPPGLSDAFGPVGYDPAQPGTGVVPAGYTDFAAPWSISFDLTYGYTPVFGQEANQRAVVSIPNFDVSLTPNWKVAGSASYDVLAGELSYTQLSVVRDLHCWEARFNWVPFGAYRSFAFSIYVKSGYLRDLLRLDVPRADVQTQIGSIL
ncbi:MAG: putative LPS assembly protein LptD [Rubricoccaceae bacterium]|nr:putative LPS assembly protein LptD [Rubricoccaceae bacterium]